MPPLASSRLTSSHPALLPRSWPQVDSSEEQCTWARPDLHGLREFCADKFGWPQAKADELLLPMLAEFERGFSQSRIDSHFSFDMRFAKVSSSRLASAIGAHTGRTDLVPTSTYARVKSGGAKSDGTRSATAKASASKTGSLNPARPGRARGGRGRGRGRGRTGGGGRRSAWTDMSSEESEEEAVAAAVSSPSASTSCASTSTSSATHAALGPCTSTSCDSYAATHATTTPNATGTAKVAGMSITGLAGRPRAASGHVPPAAVRNPRKAKQTTAEKAAVAAAADAAAAKARAVAAKAVAADAAEKMERAKRQREETLAALAAVEETNQRQWQRRTEQDKAACSGGGRSEEQRGSKKRVRFASEPQVVMYRGEELRAERVAELAEQQGPVERDLAQNDGQLPILSAGSLGEALRISMGGPSRPSGEQVTGSSLGDALRKAMLQPEPATDA